MDLPPRRAGLPLGRRLELALLGGLKRAVWSASIVDGRWDFSRGDVEGVPRKGCVTVRELGWEHLKSYGQESLLLKSQECWSMRRLQQSLLEILELRRTWRVFWARKPDHRGSGRAAQPGRAAGSTRLKLLT